MTNKLFTDGKPLSVDVDGDIYHYRTGTVAMHNLCMRTLSDSKKRQQGFAKAVQCFKTDETGKPEFDINSLEDFNRLIGAGANHNLIRKLGMAFMGMSDDIDEEDTFEGEVEQHIKNEPVKPATGSSSKTG